MAEVEALIPFFRAVESYPSPRPGNELLFSVTCDRERPRKYEESGLKDEKVAIAFQGRADLYIVRGIETFSINAPLWEGERMGLLVEPTT